MGKFLKDINLKNKIVVVTGATKGIGRATTIALHQVGANIVAIGRNQSELNTLKKKLKTKIKTFSCDVNDSHATCKRRKRDRFQFRNK